LTKQEIHMSANRFYSASEMARAAAIIDSPHGKDSYGDRPIHYPSASRLVQIGADIVALAKVKTTMTPDIPGETYEFLFEECDEQALVELSHDVAAGANLSFIHGVLAWRHSWGDAHEAVRQQLRR
jgi:hypothetical protein